MDSKNPYLKKKIALIIFIACLYQIVAISTASPVEEPYLKINFVDIDYPIIEPIKSNFTENGMYISEDNKEIRFWKYSAENTYNYHLFTDEQERLLIQACSPDITNVLKYIKQNNFTYDYNDFYTVHPSTWDGDWYDQIIEIDENWYLASYDFVFTPHPLIDNTAITFIVLTLVFFALAGLFVYKYKKTKSKKILAEIIILIIIGIILLILAIFWIWGNTQVAT